MVDIFEEKICNYCKNTQCDKNIIREKQGNIFLIKCEDYQKDEKKIVPYVEPLCVTAERDYVFLKEV